MNPAKSSLRAEDVIAWAEDQWGQPCRCGQALIGQDAVLSLLLGYKNAPACIPCLAQAQGEAPGALVHRALAHIARLDCYKAGWRHSEQRLAEAGESRPPYLPTAPISVAAAPTAAASAAPNVQDTWDAGDMGCGDLVLELRTRLAQLEPGGVLQVRATDPGAPGDLPAWCRVTGNALVFHEHPLYWIARKPQS
ncbi:MAG: sulfurtransferase TusA family protein [Planctomycetota bacterium]